MPEREIDAATPPPAPVTGHLRMGDGVIEANSRHLSRDGRPWLPVSGELHFSRYPASEWREALLKLRAGGITVVSTYAFWIAHEERRGVFRWDGDRDLRRFVALSVELGLDVVVRIGPWAHGECRNGGFPDWLLAQDCEPRTDDPRYLDLVRPWFRQLGEQLAGLPVVAIQLDNELYDRPGHLVTLRRLAEEAGLDAPLWTATGWGGAQLPAGEVLPLFGGYPEAAWDTAHDGWPEQSHAHYFFSHGRDDGSIATAPTGRPEPFATCELGGGMYTSYHRRPVIPADDVAALALTKLGSGSVWQGYYLFHGGTMGLGERSTLQESHATGYPNDCPVMTYDFQAPLGEYGQFREVFARLRAQHLFIADHGADLAPMTLRLPADAPRDPTDRDTLRWAIRSDGERGYLFVNNHQPAPPLPDHREVRFGVALGGRRLVTPAQPVTVPSGAYFVWPLNRRVGDVTIRTAAAQPLCDLVVDGVPTAVLAQTAGIPVDLLLDAAHASGPATVTAEDGGLRVSGLRPGGDCVVDVRSHRGTPARLLILDAAGARTATRAAGRLLLSEAPTVLDDGVLYAYGRADAPTPDWRRVQTAGPAPTPVIDPASGRASAPTEFGTAEVIHVDIPAGAFAGGDEVLLRVDWTGDVGRAYCDGELIADHFWFGPVWEIGLRRHRDRVVRHGVELRLLPLRQDAPIYLSPPHRPTTYENGQVLDLRSITLARLQRTRVDLNA